jgi:hypothetical protein
MQVKAEFLGLPLAPALETEAFQFLNLSPVELNPDELAARLLDALTPTTERVVIDNLRLLEQVLGARATNYLAALLRQLYAAGVSVLLLLEIKPFAGLQVTIADTPLSLLADNVVMVQQVEAQGAIHRVLAVLKMRFSGHETTLRELVIDEQGVRVLTAPQSAAGVLADAADASGLTAPPASDWACPRGYFTPVAPWAARRRDQGSSRAPWKCGPDGPTRPAWTTCGLPTRFNVTGAPDGECACVVDARSGHGG